MRILSKMQVINSKTIEMKKILIKVYASMVLLVLLGACQENNVELYDGPSLIHFLETKGNVLIDESNPVITIEVGVTKALDVSRVFDVVVDTDESTAVEGLSFELLTPTVTVDAGEVIAEVQVRGLYTGAEPTGQLLKLSLSSSNTDEVASFQNAYNLELYKFCEFDQMAFVGTFQVVETDYWQNIFEYEVESVVGDDPYSVNITGLWGTSSPVKISFAIDENTCSILNQFFFDDPDAGYDNAWIRSVEDGQYNSCMGSITGLKYFIYPEGSNQGWDLGTFEIKRID